MISFNFPIGCAIVQIPDLAHAIVIWSRKFVNNLKRSIEVTSSFSDDDKENSTVFCALEINQALINLEKKVDTLTQSVDSQTENNRKFQSRIVQLEQKLVLESF